MTETSLRARLVELPRCLRDVRCAPLADGEVAGSSFVVTGIGAAEAPARCLAALLRDERAARAVFVPLSAFATDVTNGATNGAKEHAPRALEALVVFSQGLSPNARLALARAGDFARATLFTSVSPEGARARPRAGTRATPEAARALGQFRGRGGNVVVLPPTEERGTLVRVLGPVAAMLGAALYAGAAREADVASLVDTVATAPARVAEAVRELDAVWLSRRVAFVTAGGHGELCHAARNAWLEGLCTVEPPAWDVLAIAHGPFQAFFESEILLVALERGGAERDLWERLARMLDPARHRLVRLRSELPPALAAIDHVAQVYELLCCALDARPRDLRAWPGSGHDGPLYDLAPRDD